MKFLERHSYDILVVVIYIIGMLWIGLRLSKRMKNTGDFYLGGRTLGKFYQFFLNFGNSTNTDQAVAVSREIYRQGIGGMWIQYLVLFLTPFYWFTTMLYRRVRLVTVGDFFAERFDSKFLAGAYATFTLLMALVGGGVGYMVAGKTMMALTPKPMSEYTEQQKQMVEMYEEYSLLKDRLNQGFNETEQARYEELDNRLKKGELKSFVSYVNPIVFYFIYGLIVGIYTIMGGFVAAVVTDAIQGVLIIIFSFILIPIGLSELHGLSGLHAKVPEYMFQLFGSISTSEYAWYTVAAMVLANLVSIIAGAPSMSVAGSAKNEMTARFGMIGGMFFKRLIMIAWALAGLIAIGLYSGQLHDPDLIWGHMTYNLLSVESIGIAGMIGLMLAGILAANMSTLDAGAVANSALFIKNLYQPFAPDKSEKHYINLGRVIIAFTMLGGIGTAVFVDNLLVLFKYFISLPAIFGAAIWLGFIWRRLTRWAVIIQVIICTIIYILIPNVFPELETFSKNEKLLLETSAQTVLIKTGALQEDVDAGLATTVGQTIEKRHVIESVGVFFEDVVRINPEDPDSPKMGTGRFHAELWVLSWFSWLGYDLSTLSKASLVALRFAFDALFPFVLLFIISFFTNPVEKRKLDAFFSKMHTPVQKSLDEDARVVAENIQKPDKFENDKIFPGSNWEILKPSWYDYAGFFGSWIMVGVIIIILWLVVTVY
ncbi:sodium:solute symporter family protein [candidate division KSB1 bacterium]|nr:sodium:solute symporter family protein [candidate division KSB1 bacterium]